MCNNPSALLKQGEAFLVKHPLREEAQNNTVDVRREFYAFADVFIEVAERTRNPAEILTNQKLESLHRGVRSQTSQSERLSIVARLKPEAGKLKSAD